MLSLMGFGQTSLSGVRHSFMPLQLEQKINLIFSFLSIDGQARKKLGNLITHIQSRKEEQRARETKMAEVIWCFGEHDLSFSSLFLTSHSSASFWPLQKFGCFLVDHLMRDIHFKCFFILLFRSPEKATKFWNNLSLVLTLLSKCQKRWKIFF